MKKTLVTLGTLLALMIGAQSFAACPCSNPCPCQMAAPCCQKIAPCCPVVSPACPIATPCCNSCNSSYFNNGCGCGCNTGCACNTGCGCGCGCNNCCREKCSWWKFWQNKCCCDKCNSCCD